MRSFWSGDIAFGLVTIPAKLYTATKNLTPQFRLLHKECGTPIVNVRRCPKHHRDLAWDEIGKGYEVQKGEYALFTPEELAKLEGDEAAGTIEIVSFVDPGTVDFAYIDNSYWVGPASRSLRGYGLLRHVLEQTGKAALAKVRLRSRTRLALLRPRGRLFALDLIRFADELVSGDEIAPDEIKPAAPKEEHLALRLVRELAGEFDPEKHPDAYRSAVLAAVEKKVAAGETRAPEGTAKPSARTARAGQVIDLTGLLSQSLKAARQPVAARTRTPGPAKAPTAGANTHHPTASTKQRRAAG